MNSKKIISLAVLLAVAVVAIVLVKTLGNREPSEESLRYFPGATEKTVGSVLIKDAQNRVLLKRKGDAWFVVTGDAIPEAMKKTSGLANAMGDEKAAEVQTAANVSEFPADSSAIAQLLQNVVSMKKHTLISENPANQGSFEIDSVQSTLVEAYDSNGKPLGALLLGKSGPDYNSVYSRNKGSNAVYLMLEISKFTFSTDNGRWADKSIMKFDKSTVQQVSIEKKDAPAMVIARGDSVQKGWQLVAPAPKSKTAAAALDTAKVDEIISSFAGLMAAELEFAAPADSVSGLADPAMTVTLTFKGGTTRTVFVGNMKPGQSKLWLKVPEKPYIYLVNDFDQKKWDKKPEELTAQALKPIEAVPAPIPEKKFNMPLK